MKISKLSFVVLIAFSCGSCTRYATPNEEGVIKAFYRPGTVHDVTQGKTFAVQVNKDEVNKRKGVVFQPNSGGPQFLLVVSKKGKLYGNEAHWEGKREGLVEQFWLQDDPSKWSFTKLHISDMKKGEVYYYRLYGMGGRTMSADWTPLRYEQDVMFLPGDQPDKPNEKR